MYEDLIEISKEAKDIENASVNSAIQLATVTAVTSTGLKLLIDGADSAGNKAYKCNTSILFHVGDRVKISKCSGTYIVEYIVGNPRTS